MNTVSPCIYVFFDLFHQHYVFSAYEHALLDFHLNISFLSKYNGVFYILYIWFISLQHLVFFF